MRGLESLIPSCAPRDPLPSRRTPDPYPKLWATPTPGLGGWRYLPSRADDDLEERLAWLERAVERLSQQSNPPITLPPRKIADQAELSPAVQELLRSGNTVGAIQQHRLDTGCSLAEAKAAVDSFAG